MKTNIRPKALTDRDVFAIRLGDLVELRAAFNPPLAKVSKLTKTLKVKAGTTIPTEDGGEYVTRAGMKKVVFKQTFFIGGTVLGYTNAYNYYRHFLAPIPNQDQMVKLAPKKAAMVLNPAWRKRYL